MSPRHSLVMLLLGCGLLGAAAQESAGVVFFDTASPTHNITAPTGALADSGWQYQGYYSNFLGTMISPKHFLTARHLGQPQPTFVWDELFNGTATVTYNVDSTVNGGTGYWDIPDTDQRILQIEETFPIYAPLYEGLDEVGKDLVVMGRGGPRGGEVFADAELKGWRTTAADGIARWGGNRVSEIVNSNMGPLLAAEFNAVSGIDESQLSVGDSGGGVFVQEDGLWKLAGINYAVDGPFADNAEGTGSFNAALFDMGGLYVQQSGGWSLVTNTPANKPSSFYASRVSTSRDEILAIIVPEPAGGLLAGLAWIVLAWTRSP